MQLICSCFLFIFLCSLLNSYVSSWSLWGFNFIHLSLLASKNPLLFSRNDCFQTEEATLIVTCDRFALLREKGGFCQPAIPTHDNNMDRQSRNNRSLLAMAGENSLINNSSKHSFKPSLPYKPIREKYTPPSAMKIDLPQSTLFDPKQIIKKLGLGRLRKMQALVRGFLVRRKVYPKELQDYLVAQSVLELITANVIYRQVSGIVVETVAIGHYDQQQGGEARMLEEYLYNAIIKRVIEKEFLPIARQAVYETAIYASRPQITFGFNLRDPLELAIYLKLNAIIEQESKQVAEEALREEAAERRELQVIDELIATMGIVGRLCQEIVGECLLESVEQYVVETIVGKVVQEGAKVVAEVVYNDKLNEIQDKHVDQLVEQAEAWLLQECILTFVADMPANHRILPDKL